MKPLALLGLDSLPCGFLRRYPETFPFLSALLQEAKLQPLQSCDPPITIPAWSVITTGKDPGELDVYGFRRRQSPVPMDDGWVDSRDVFFPRIWDSVVAAGGNAFVWGVPQTWPYPQRRGLQIGGCILDEGLQGLEGQPELQCRMRSLLQQEYLSDAAGYRTQELDSLANTLENMLQQKQKILGSMTKNPASFQMLVCMESDRLNHAFYRFVDRAHPQFEVREKYCEFFHSFYRRLDALVQKFFHTFQRQGIQPYVLSDHGARILQGMFRIQEWLIRRGYLVLKVDKTGKVEFKDVDWEQTSVYSTGGYCGRVWIHKEGREPSGWVKNPVELLQKLQHELRSDLSNLGLSLHFQPTDEVWKTRARLSPDALFYISDLDYRVSSAVGPGSLVLPLNDTGPDGVNHDFEGIFGGLSREAFPAELKEVKSFLEKRMEL